MTRGVLALAVAGLMLAAGCGGGSDQSDSAPAATEQDDLARTATGASAPATEDLARELLTDEDLGTGFTGRDDVGDASGELCGVALPTSGGRERSWREEGGGAAIRLEVAVLSPEAAERRILDLEAALDSCVPGAETGDLEVRGTGVDGIGDRALGLSTNTSGNSNVVRSDGIIMRRAGLVAAVYQVVAGTPDPELTRRVARAVDRRLFIAAGG